MFWNSSNPSTIIKTLSDMDSRSEGLMILNISGYLCWNSSSTVLIFSSNKFNSRHVNKKMKSKDCFESPSSIKSKIKDFVKINHRIIMVVKSAKDTEIYTQFHRFAKKRGDLQKVR